MRNTPVLHLVSLKENAWLAALCRLRDNPALSVCASKGHMTESGCTSIAEVVSEGRRQEFAWKEWTLLSESASCSPNATLGESEPVGEHARPGRYQSTGVSPPFSHPCCSVKGTHKLTQR